MREFIKNRVTFFNITLLVAAIALLAGCGVSGPSGQEAANGGDTGTQIGGVGDWPPPVTAAIPPGGTYETAEIVVTLDCDSCSETYYTFNADGAENVPDILYTGPITLTTTTNCATLRFYSVNSAGIAEEVKTEIYWLYPSSVSYSVSGAVSGLAGTGLVLQNNGGDDLAITANGVFSFSTPISDGATYNVTVLTQPSNQTCFVKNGIGRIGADVTNVSVTCSGFSYFYASTSASDSAIAAGGYHTIALKSDGTVWAWGRNNYGQLGNGTTTNSTTPLQVSGLTDVTAIAGGEFHTIALKTDGTVWTWGIDRYGQLGVETTETCGDYDTPCSTTPLQVSGLTDVTAIAGGAYHTIAVQIDGTVRAWGGNWIGQLGNGTTTDSTTPVQVSSLTDVIAISSGYTHTIALKSDGTVRAWGGNGEDQLGAGTLEECNYTPCSTTPLQVSGLADVTAIAAGGWYNTSVKTDGTLWAWGYDGGDPDAPKTLLQVSGIADVNVMAGGGYHTIAVKTDGSVWAWKYNSYGQLGDGTTTYRYVPVPVGTPDRSYYVGGTLSGLADGATVVLQNNGGDDLAITANGDFTFFTPIAGLSTYSVTVLTRPFGQDCVVIDGSGVIGSDVTNVSVRCFDFLTNVAAIAGGQWHTVALKNGSVWAWGGNWIGQLGDGTTNNSGTPVRVSGLTDVIAISSGYTHTIALKSDGSVRAWGDNGFGQLGVETTEICNDGDCSTTPVQVTGITNVIAVAAGRWHTVALKTDGTVWAWGDNWYGQLGNGTTNSSNTPVQVSGLANVVAIAGGSYHTIALKSDGSVWTWGYSDYGQLGTTATEICSGSGCSTTPLQVSGLTDVTAIAAGMYHTIALKSDGSVWTWGYNIFGQLGVITTETCNDAPCSTTPLQVSSLTDVTAIAGGSAHTLAFKTDGTLWTWGDNRYGQLGVITTETCTPYSTSYPCSTTPLQVSGLTDVTAIAGGSAHTLALKTGGTLWAWGTNKYGQLGITTTETCGNYAYPCSTTPLPVWPAP